MPRKTYLTEIMLYSHKRDDREVTITHRRKTAAGVEYFDKTYRTPTKASQGRIDAVVSDWVNRNQADIRLMDNCLFVEPTI